MGIYFGHNGQYGFLIGFIRDVRPKENLERGSDIPGQDFNLPEAAQFIQD